MVQIYYSNVNNRSKNNDFLPNSTSQIRYFFYKCLLCSFPSDFVPRSMAATVLHDMVLNCDVQGLKAPDTNWWMVLGLARLWGKTVFWQVFFGPKPIGSNQKNGAAIWEKRNGMLGVLKFEVDEFEIPQLISCCFSAPGVPKQKSELSWSLARQLSRICRKRVLTSRRGGLSVWWAVPPW